MKKVFALILFLLMIGSVGFAEEEPVEPRPYYEMPKIEFEMKDDFVSMESLTKYKSEGYCFMYDDKQKPFVIFVFSLTPLEESNTLMSMMIRSAHQNNKELKYGTIDSHYFSIEDWTDPAITNGFKIPSEVVFGAQKDETRYISMPFILDNLEDDVIVDMSYYGVDNFTVPIPDDAFLEPVSE